MPTRPTTAFPALLIVATLAACGGDDSEGEPTASKPAGTVLDVTAVKAGNGPLRFQTKRLEAKAGPITIDFRNDDTILHNVRVQTGSKCCFGPGNKDVGGTMTMDPGRREKATLTLKPGRYVFLCSLGGHYNSDSGKMRGTLLVR